LTNVQVVQKAVSDRTGKAKLFDAWSPGGHSLRMLSGWASCRGTPSPEITVETATLDDFFADSSIHPRLVKMDIEGADPVAPAGMKRPVLEPRVLSLRGESLTGTRRPWHNEQVLFHWTAL